MNRRGVSLYFVMVILFLLLGVSLGISTVITSQIVMIRLTGDSVIAEAAAEAGVEEGLYVFYTHGMEENWVNGLSGSVGKSSFSTCGTYTDFEDPYLYTGNQIIPGVNSKYRYRFYYNKQLFVATAAGYYPNRDDGKDVSLRVVSGSWK